MRVKALVLDGFKSYGDKTEIKGWDEHFNCVTGRNGSGKSNILDALTFVLGLSSLREVRATKLRDLIYNKIKGRRACTVSVIFDNSDPRFKPQGYTHYPEITVSRQILTTIANPSNNAGPKEDTISQYRINGAKVEADHVKALFKSVQLNIQNPNFLVRQGQAMHVIEASAATVLKKIEEAAGTFLFQQEAVKSEKELQRCESDIKAYTIQIEENIEPTVARLQQTATKYREAKEQHDTLKIAERIVPAKDYMELRDQQLKLSEQRAEKKGFQEKNNALAESTSAEITNLKAQLKDLRELARARQQDGALSAQQQELSTQITTKQVELETLVKSLAELEREAVKCTETINSNTTKLGSFSGQSEASLKEYEQEAETLENTRQELENTNKLLAGLETGVSASGERDSGYAAQLRTLREQISDLESKIAKGEERASVLANQINPQQYKASKVEVEKLQAHETQLNEALQAKTSELEAARTANPANESAKSRYQQLQNDLRKAEQDLNSLRRRDSRLDFSVPGFSSKEVRGLVGHLFNLKPEYQAKANALEVCAGGNLFNVVIESDEVGTRLLNSGLRRRVTLLPLNKIRAFELAESKVANAKRMAESPSDVDLAVDTIDYERDVEKAMKYVFGSTLIASDSELATKVTYNPSVASRTITLQGDVYDPQGTLSGGAAQRGSGVLKLFQEYNTLTAKITEIKKQLAGAGEDARKAAAGSNKLDEISAEISSIKNSIQATKQKLAEGSHGRNVSNYEKNQADAETIKENLVKWKHDLETLKAKFAKVQKDSTEFTTNKEGKLAEIRQTIAQLKQTEKKLAKKQAAKRETYYNLKGSRDVMETEIRNSAARIEVLQVEVASLKDQRLQYERNIAHLQAELDRVDHEVSQQREEQDRNVSQVATLEQTIANLEEEVSSARMAAQVAGQEHEAIEKEYTIVNNKMHALTRTYTCLEKDMSKLGVAGGEYDYEAVSASRINALRRVLGQRNIIKAKWNAIPATFSADLTRATEEQADIKTKVKRLESDKKKILGTINDLTQKRHEEVERVFHQISDDMGEIFGTMLPGCSCKLERVDPEDVMKGINIRARIGPNWKSSISELSGGQKSLAGLCFIFAMLKHRPAPFYILDEVDAALDLQHTQNLGVVFKTLFSESQFIVVSLKENMFANADRIYKVENDNGSSRVTVVGDQDDDRRRKRHRGL